MLIVTKFGGSSLSSRSQFQKVKAIIDEDPNRQVVVVSALGKGEGEVNKLTDLLFLIAAHIRHGVNYDLHWETIEKRFLSVKNQLGLTYDVSSELAELRQSLDQDRVSEEFLVSRGEYLTGKLMSEYLGFEFVDAKDVIMFHPSGEVDLKLSRERLQQAIPPQTKVVIPGFYGAYLSGRVKLLNRGGSDITAAIVASCLEADKYENWTDVPGVLMADPRIITEPVSVAELTYEELSELSYMGANVLHEETIYPIRDLNIPIHIKNTNDPGAPGTVISDRPTNQKSRISGISGKKDFLSINIFKNKMSTEVGFLRKVFSIFERYQINVEHVPTGIDHVGIILSAQEAGEQLDSLLEALARELGADEITLKEDLSLITIVGQKIISDARAAQAIFTALAREGISVQLIAQSPREINMMVGVTKLLRFS